MSKDEDAKAALRDRKELEASLSQHIFTDIRDPLAFLQVVESASGKRYAVANLSAIESALWGIYRAGCVDPLLPWGDNDFMEGIAGSYRAVNMWRRLIGEMEQEGSFDVEAWINLRSAGAPFHAGNWAAMMRDAKSREKPEKTSDESSSEALQKG